jgi:integrase
MSPRPRKPKYRALPTNLYATNGGKSFMYRHPVSGKRHGMGGSKTLAIAAAKELNALLVPESDLVAKVLGRVTVAEHVTWFYENVIPERDYRPNTIGTYKAQTNKLIVGMGWRAIEEITVQDLAELMEPFTARSANQFRQVAVDVFRVAVSRGICMDNPAAATLKRREKKARMRLTRPQFDAVRDKCPLWVQNAMDLALVTLQRRNDVARMKFDGVRDSRLYVVQEKTDKYDSGYLSIAVGPTLSKIIKRCRDDLASPYMVHRKPQRKVKERAGLDHWTQVSPPMLTRAFSTARDECGLFDSVDTEARPTFHEIRALGIKLYRDQGLDPQKLAGHASAKMTSNYDSGHDDIRWTEAAAELKI